jgi:hypothetical protein
VIQDNSQILLYLELTYYEPNYQLTVVIPPPDAVTVAEPELGEPKGNWQLPEHGPPPDTSPLIVIVVASETVTVMITPPPSGVAEALPMTPGPCRLAAI